MQLMPFLNKKQVKVILEYLKEQYGFSEELNYQFLLSNKDNLYAINKDIEKIDLNDTRVNSLGLYMGEMKQDVLRLSMEGAQLVGPHANKSILDIGRDQLRSWMKGEDLVMKQTEVNDMRDFVLLRHDDDIVGCGKMKEGKVLNFVPKTRRVSLL